MLSFLLSCCLSFSLFVSTLLSVILLSVLLFNFCFFFFFAICFVGDAASHKSMIAVAFLLLSVLLCFLVVCLFVFGVVDPLFASLSLTSLSPLFVL